MARAAILWPAGIWLRRREVLGGHRRADGIVDAGDHHVVGGVEADDGEGVEFIGVQPAFV